MVFLFFVDGLMDGISDSEIISVINGYIGDDGFLWKWKCGGGRFGWGCGGR